MADVGAHLPRDPTVSAAGGGQGRATAETSRRRTRRRGALLQLARRHGEVRLRVSEGRAAVASAADLCALLDDLNAQGQLRWGGLQRDSKGAEIVYLAA